MLYSLILLVIIVIAFMLQIFIPSFTEIFIFDPNNLQIWQFVSSIFLHGGVMHIFLNGYALLMFGSILERKIGSDEFLKIFFAAGLAGNFLYWATILAGIIPPIPALGASGAVFGIMGALAILEPRLQLLLFGIIPLNIRHATVLWIVLELFGSFNPASGIASAAHLGGLFVGLAMGKWLEKKIIRQHYYKWRREPY